MTVKVLSNLSIMWNGDIRLQRLTELEKVSTEEMMTAAETTFETEIERIERWRSEELERAGYPAMDAAELAARHDVDLHRATELLAAGCPPDLALRILL